MNLDKNKIRSDALNKIDYRSSAHHAIDATIDACAAQYNPVIADLQAQVEALRKDAERLDYIEKYWYVSGVVQHDDGWYLPEKSLTFKTFRQAIDAAISKGGE